MIASTVSTKLRRAAWKEIRIPRLIRLQINGETLTLCIGETIILFQGFHAILLSPGIAHEYSIWRKFVEEKADLDQVAWVFMAVFSTPGRRKSEHGAAKSAREARCSACRIRSVRGLDQEIVVRARQPRSAGP